MPEHDCLGIESVQLASTLMYRSRCRCGESWLRPSQDLADVAWEAHWRREAATPWIESMRETLEQARGGEVGS